MSKLGRTLVLGALNAAVYAALLVFTPMGQLSADEGGGAYYMQTCACIRVDPMTGTCAEWEALGCPRAKVHTCGSGCPDGGGGGGGPELPGGPEG